MPLDDEELGDVLDVPVVPLLVESVELEPLRELPVVPVP